MFRRLIPCLSAVAIMFFLLAATASADFGFKSFQFSATNADGTPDTQAGSHPFQVTTSFTLNTELPASGEGEERPSGSIKTIKVALPPGLVGDATVVPQCSQEEFATEEADPNNQIVPICSNTSVVGIAKINISANLGQSLYAPIYNLAPPLSEPAEFGFYVASGVPIILVPSVRTSGDNALEVESANTSQGLSVFASSITFWGVPGDPRHDKVRGPCLEQGNLTGTPESDGETCPGDENAKPLLTLPTSCNGPMKATAELSSWQEPNHEVFAESLSRDQQGNTVEMVGCNQLEFGPSIEAAPDTSIADTPAGLTVDVKVPQEGLVSEEALAAADVKNTTVTLPPGVTVNPGQAAGLQACQPGEDGVGSENAPSCPAASKVGTVEITTPLLRDKLQGTVYVLQSNPPDLQLLIAASADGVNVKLLAKVHLDEATGQLTTKLDETPQLPFTDFKLSFSGGAQAALATPLTCGLYTTTSDFTPWSTPLQTDAFPDSSFEIDGGPNGGSCTAPLPFSPSMIAGSTTDQAGGYSDFSLLLTRADGQQRVSRLQFKTPEGLLGMISKVPLCQEPQANEGTCSDASQIGHTVVEAGPGPYPLVVPQPGQPPAPIYLTGGYDGAPYGLSIVVPLHVGPFTLKTQVVRARIEVDPLTSQLTVTTSPLPQIIDGVPADLRAINAVIDRPGFIFNPTSCAPMSFSGTATGTEGATQTISSPFQMGSCRSLVFKPNFMVSTSGKTSRTEGASLEAKILYPTTPLGANQASSQSNIKLAKVELPKQLPSRLTTLQKACTEAVFSANPTNCPAASMIGHATAVTPVLPVALSGPAYFVSNGGAKFPELIVVLQGYGVTVDLHGETFISKAGITSSTFKSVPDVPISSFDLVLPEGPNSALAANGNLCKTKLQMPTEFVAQNGAVIHQTTNIAVTGCAPALGVVHHSAKGKKATVIVSVPSAGKVVASGMGLSTANKRASKAGRVTLNLSISDKERAFLAEHQGRMLAATINLRFTPSNGKGLTSSVTMLLR